MTTTAVHVRHARASDAPAITACVCAAYLHYIERIGRQPEPMLHDYDEVIRYSQVHVATSAGRIVGAIVLKRTDEGFCIDNVAVHPDVQRSGVGTRLMDLAEREARRQGHESVYLCTHELMTENRAIYARRGFREYDRRVVEGYARVFFRKTLK